MDDALDPELLAHLRGIVAVWMTNGQQPVNGANDTRTHDFFDGSWTDAAEETLTLAEQGYVEQAGEAEPCVNVVPTAKGVFVAMGGQSA